MASHHMISTPEGRALRLHCTGDSPAPADYTAAGLPEGCRDLGYCSGAPQGAVCATCVDEAIAWERTDRELRGLAWNGTGNLPRLRSEGAHAAYAAEVQAFRRRLLAIHRANRPALSRRLAQGSAR